MNADVNSPWSELVEAEPALARLYAEIVSAGSDYEQFCAIDAWNNRFKSKLIWLVGFRAHGKNECLHTRAAYNVAMRRLYEALPPCRGCGCCS
jgi:hypothetical protein